MALSAKRQLILNTTGWSIFSLAYAAFYLATFLYIVIAIYNVVSLCNVVAMYLAITFVISFFSVFLWIFRIIQGLNNRDVAEDPTYQPIDENGVVIGPTEEQIKRQVRTDNQLVYLTYLTLVLCTVVVILQLTFTIFVAVIKTQSAPRYTGTFPVDMRDGLKSRSKPPIIDRDENNIIHITAENEYDLLYAQGVAMAQERLFQMDLQRRVGRGKVSEIVGTGGLPIDKLMRTLGIYTAVEHDVRLLPEDTKKKLTSFCAGINAYIKSDQPLTIEFWLLGYTPSVWTIEDVLVNIKIMAWTLDGNLNSEMYRYIMQLNGIPNERITNTLFPPYPQNAPTVLNAFNTIQSPSGRKLNAWNEHVQGAYIPSEQEIQNGPYTMADNSAIDAFLPGASDSATVVQESNNWVLGGNITDTGLPLLGCDTHLSISALGQYLLMHLRVDPSGQFNGATELYELDVIGASLVGLPTIVIGRNGNGVSWGMTNAGADVKDYFILDETSNKNGYMLNGGVSDYSKRIEVIKVKDSADVEHEVLTTVFGPVVNKVLQLPGTKQIALKWMGTVYKNDRTCETFFKLMRVSNWTEFKNAFSTYVGPAQNFVYGDVKNNIGYILPGQFPIREGGFNGLFPVPGNGSYNWADPNIKTQNFNNIPYAVLSPAQQGQVAQPYFFSANNKPYVTSSVDVGSDWLVDDYRAVRIESLLKEKTAGGRKVLFSDMIEMQLDTKSPIFLRHKGILEKMEPFGGIGISQEVELFRQRLLKWDGNEANNKEATVFEEWIFNLATLAGKEVNLTFVAPNHGQDPTTLELQRFFSHRYVFGAIDAETRLNITDKNCLPHGNCVKFARKMFELSVTDLKTRFGNVPTWSELVHWSDFNHPVFARVEALQCVSCRRIYTKGGSHTLNVAPPTLGMERFASNFGPTYRQLVDLKNPENSLFINVMGQSGNMLSQFYDNYMTLWKRGQYIPMRMKGYTIQSRVSF